MLKWLQVQTEDPSSDLGSVQSGTLVRTHGVGILAGHYACAKRPVRLPGVAWHAAKKQLYIRYPPAVRHGTEEQKKTCCGSVLTVL